jgi:hypothetical protein
MPWEKAADLLIIVGSRRTKAKRNHLVLNPAGDEGADGIADQNTAGSFVACGLA